MIKILKQILPALVLIYSVGSLADNQLFQLDLRGYPKTATKCETAVQQVKKQIESHTAAKILSSKCMGGEDLQFFIRLVYTAEAELKINSSDIWPIHSSYAACRQNIATEKANYESITGLKPFLEYCALVAADYERNILVLRYSTVFLTTGNPKSVEDTFEIRNSNRRFGFIYGNPSKLGEEFSEKFKKSGFPVSSVFVDQSTLYSRIWLKLHRTAGKTKPNYERMFRLKYEVEKQNNDWTSPFDDGQPQQMDTPAQCYEQMELAKEIFSKSFTSPVIWMCVWIASEDRMRLLHFRIRPGAESFNRLTPGLEGEPFLNEYPNREKCEQNKGAVLTYYKNKLGENLVGALCSFPVAKQPQIPVKMFIYTLRDL